MFKIFQLNIAFATVVCWMLLQYLFYKNRMLLLLGKSCWLIADKHIFQNPEYLACVSAQKYFMAKVEELTKDFLNALSDIEFQYLTFFILRKSRMKDDTFDKLKNHYWFAIERGTPVFGFLYESDLPSEIRMRCRANYVHFFPEGYIYGHIL